MKRKVFILFIIGVMALGLVGCGGPKETDKKYPFFNEMQIVKINDEEKLSLKINEEETKEKISELLSDFESAAKEGTTKNFEKIDMPINNVEGTDVYSTTWQNYSNLMGFKFGDSQGILGFTVKEDPNSDKNSYNKTIMFTVGLVSMYQTKDYDINKHDAIVAEVNWLNTQGFNISIEEIDSKLKDMLNRANNGEVVENEVIKLDEDGTEMTINLVKAGDKVYNAGFIINGYTVYLNNK